MKRRQRKPKPGPLGDGRFEIGTKQIDDPWEPGSVIVVPCNMRESPIEHMASRHRINRSQVAAADRYRRLYEASRVSPLKSLDTTQEPVDGGRIATGPTDRLIDAAKELAAVNKQVGQQSASLLMAIVGEGVAISIVAGRYGTLAGDHAMGYTTGRLIEALDGLVSFWKMIGVGSASKIRGSRETGQGTAREWIVGRHGDLVEKGIKS